MNEAVLIFPHQLFKQHPALAANRQIFIVEEWLYFRQYNFHKHKILLYRAAMKFYEGYLTHQNYKVTYIESIDERNDVRKLIAWLAKINITDIHFSDPADDWLGRRIRTCCNTHAIQLTEHYSPAFLNNRGNVAEYYDKKKTYFQTDFYIHQRKQRNILMEPGGKPAGGKWTFDADNRRRFPKKEIVPAINFPELNSYMQEAVKYVQQNFSDNYGNVDGPYFFACTFEDADAWLADFIKNRFAKFGIYEDAIVASEKILYHAVLSPMVNTGLLVPQQILNAVLQQAGLYNIPMNSLEGFVRQLIGWREFIRLVYEREGRRQRTCNYWKFKRKIPAAFWTGTTGILPVDITIKKILQTGYCHHIERLMVLGNFMLLCEFDPDEVYRWFMEMFIDACDWVMVPNVYGMTQFADGGLMTTKPYISGSNYLMKMGDYDKGEWQQIWDGLFWRFMHVHRNFFLQNPRLGLLVGTLDKMSTEKKETHLSNAEKYLNSLG